MSSFEKSVKGGTKVKLAPPKSKYVEHILLGTNTGEAGVAEVFRTLTHRLRDSTWTVAFKSLIIVHLMIKEGAPDTTLRFLATAPKNRLAVNQFTDVQTQGQNIRRYQEYLVARALAYAVTRCDYVRAVGDGRMKRLTVDKGLLRETEVIQDQIKALVKCDFFAHDAENEISLTAFRLLTRDLLDLFSVENEAVMNVLSHYFEMSKPDAERAINIYKAFCKQTDQVVQYLQVAREFEHATRLEVPKLKHAPTSLVNSLQEYLDDKDFDVNRRQYLAEQEAKKTGKPFQKSSTQTSKAPPATSSTPVSASAAARAEAVMAPQQAKGPAPDLIDFFESIEQNQQAMGQAAPNPFLPQQQPQTQAAFQQPQMTGFQSQQQGFGFQQPQPTGANGFNPQPLQTQFTGAGFGGYGPQPQQQQSFATGNAFAPSQQQFAGPAATQTPGQMPQPQALQPQQTGSTNPFRQSMMLTGGVGAFNGFAQPQEPQRQSTNPFAKAHQQPQMPSISEQQPFSHHPPQQPQPQPLVAQQTGTNPFARPAQQTTSPMSPPSALQVQPTGSTNPFRQSAFVNQATGQGWQNAPQATMGGLEKLETVPVFPRPGQAPVQSQQQQQSPWGY
ncbi:ENTH domain-containing protein [Teratosphaeria destructans]|uniref:ENTH domain-containing protein n=1 Tax=Teratosphaeria destructans TaxID=418781 RepID=A0A9W7SUP5_9PEZI|nr:ENTH domain-containing protein [Teratosphaeria destructans]